MPRKKSEQKYPRLCEILVHAREPTERERWIDLRPGAENPRTPTRACGIQVLDEVDDHRHMASAHPDLWRTLEVLAEIAIAGVRSPQVQPSSSARSSSARGKRSQQI